VYQAQNRMKIKVKTLNVFLILAALAAPVLTNASAIEQFKVFVTENKTFSAEFTQVIANKKKREEARGQLDIARPGKFRWEYTTPHVQLIVGDSRTLWVYDKDLAQATRKTQNVALGSSPASLLLAGNNTIEQHYHMEEAGKIGEIEWLSARPKRPDQNFRCIRMGFKANILVGLELIDGFGNYTTVRFSAPRQNPPISTEHFTFSLPKGVDVISTD
jgi:outer membrane lipoprotein carrier protein